jgi:hypothetical protein
MIWSLLAEALVFVHFGFTAFAVFGGFLSWRWPRAVLLHLPALAWGIWIELSHAICPLTPLEIQLRRLGGEAGYTGGFLAHYLGAILYPVGLTPHIQYLLAALLVAVNLIAYGRWLVRRGVRVRGWLARLGSNQRPGD